jgi:hypothetical protein
MQVQLRLYNYMFYHTGEKNVFSTKQRILFWRMDILFLKLSHDYKILKRNVQELILGLEKAR